MDSILSQLYFGNLAPFELPLPQKAQLLQQRAYEAHDTYRNTLDETQRKAFDAMFDLQSDLQCATGEAAFIAGFKTGTQIVVEALLAAENSQLHDTPSL